MVYSLLSPIKLLLLPILLAMSLFFNSCGSGDDTVYDEQQEDFLPHADYEEFSKEVEDLEKKILSQQNPDEKLLKEATTKFQDFAGFFPEDPKSPEYLLKASDYYLILGEPEMSVKLLNRIMNDYPDYERMEDVVFNKASHLDFELRDTTEAKKAYEEFITRYPNSDLVDDAQNRIENIGLSLEELAEKFIKDLEKNPQ